MSADSLRGRIAGSVVARDDPDYEQVRGDAIWNLLQPDRRPELIVRVRSAADVVAAVRFAREQRLGVAVRGRGHSWCAAPLRDGTVLIDLAGLDGIDIDRGAQAAWVEPAVTGRQLSGALARTGLAFPIGHCSPVPMSGYLLSGGLGWNCSGWGPACASVRAVELVTADGSRITASETSHPDLFWAARGAGPCFFAVATRFHLHLRDLPAAMQTSTYTYPSECADAVAGWAATLALERDVELTLFVSAPPGAPRRVCTLTATAFTDAPEHAARALRPLAESPLIDRCLAVVENQSTPFEALLDNVDGMFPARHRYLADNAWTHAPAGDVLPALRERFTTAPSAKSGLLCMLSGLPAQVPDMAFSLRDRTYFGCYAIWDDARDDAANQAWFRATIAVLDRHATGHYIGESDIVFDPSRAARAFSPPAWRRLRELRRRYDPDGMFAAPYVR
jgi:FAD/FMN-containing dehydrogenase